LSVVRRQDLTGYLELVGGPLQIQVYLLQLFQITFQTTYKKQITWNGNNRRTLRDRNPANYGHLTKNTIDNKYDHSIKLHSSHYG